MYLWLKLFHIIAVIAFLGNITTGLFWHAHAARTRDARILAHTMDGIILSDRFFTGPGVLGILVAGIWAALNAGIPILDTGWIWWTLILFGVSGVVFATRLAPLQRRLRDLATSGAASTSFDYDGYRRLALRWELWGALALVTPFVGLILMVLKPNL